MSKVIEYLNKKNISYTIKDDNAQMICPFCKDPKKEFYINIDHGGWQCWRKKECGKTGSFYNLKQKYGDAPIVGYDKKVYKKPKKLKETSRDKLIKWFENRKISEKTLNKLKVTCTDNWDIVFRYYKNGELTNNKCRNFEKTKHTQTTDAEPLLYNRDNISKDAINLIITEGEIDCLSLVELGFNFTVSIPGGASNLKWIDSEFDFLQRFSNFYLFYDFDSAGEENIIKVVKRLGMHKCYRVNSPCKDANEWLLNGLTYQKFTKSLRDSIEFRPKEVITIEDLKGKLLTPQKEGQKIGNPKFDATLGGQRFGEVTVWTGRNGTGKTTLLNQVCINTLINNLDEKFCIASLEMKPESLCRWMMTQLNLKHNNEGVEKFYKLTAERLFFVNIFKNVKPDLLLETFEYVYHRFGVRYYTIDSLLRIDLSDDINTYEGQKKFMNLILDFADKTDSYINLVAHPRKSENDFKPINKVDVSGSGDITNLAWNVIALNRVLKKDSNGNPENEVNVMNLSVLKNREFGKLGTIEYKFLEEFKAFVETDEVAFYRESLNILYNKLESVGSE